MSYEEYFRNLLVDNYTEDIDTHLYKEKNNIIKKIDKTNSDIDEIQEYIQLSEPGQIPNFGRNVSINDLNEDLKELQIKLDKLNLELNHHQNKINYWNENKNYLTDY